MGRMNLLDELLDPVSECFDEASAQRLADFRIAPSLQDRMAELAARANEGLLSPEEQDQYEALINAADLIAILQLKVRKQRLAS